MIKRFYCLFLLILVNINVATATATNPLEALIAEIKELESDREPKCYATASRLEDFMYGTPLSSEARFQKIELQKILIAEVWRQATDQARQAGAKTIDKTLLNQIFQKHIQYRQLDDKDWEVTGKNAQTLTIKYDDLRQYASVAYALRAILAVQQDAMVATDSDLLPMTEDSLPAFQQFLDIVTLTALQNADQKARINHVYEVSAKLLTESWTDIAGSSDQYQLSLQLIPAKRSDFKVIKQIIAQKMASYEAYNEVNMQLFMRNLQVYFAKQRWPKDEAVAKRFKTLFTEAMIQYSHDFYMGSERVAIAASHPLIRVDDVKRFADQFVPHRINEYEDAVFFPKLPLDQQVVIESYDMDAFRDSGIHWQYLKSAIEGNNFQGALETDPFAAELLVENIAQYGVLLLRAAGMVSKQNGDERLKPEHIELGFRQIQAHVKAHAQAQPEADKSTTELASSGGAEVKGPKKFFIDVTKDTDIDFMHRSSDWLNRLIRSFAMKSEGVGEITIPPAFGGSGVAAEDINNDGWPDILILGGLGNKLYLNNGQGGFTDITKTAGLDWLREDGTPGETRQPIIADFDNDGKQDILISYVDDNHRLYRNLGDAKFEDVTEQSGLGGKGLVGGPLVAFDYDNDGLLDVYVSNFGDYINGVLPTLKRFNYNGQANLLFRNKGGFQFENVTEGSGVDNSGWGQAASHTDLDNDGWQDLIVGNDFGSNAYYRNNRDGTFTEISKMIGTNKPSYTMSVGLADLNSDQYPDVYISNIVTMNKDETYVTPDKDTTMKFNPDKLAKMRVVEANDLFISQVSDNKLQGYELSKLVERGYSSTGWAWDADFFDADNDGDDDLYVVNGMNEFNLYSTENPYYTDPLKNENQNVIIPPSSKDANVFFINHGGKLQNISERSGLDLVSNSRSVAYLDYDDDGDLDMIINNYHEPAVFYQNRAETLDTHWLKIKLIGDPKQGSNRDAIGARVLIGKDDGNIIWREVHGSIGYLSVHPKQIHIGLGQQQSADITVRWPNGEIKKYQGLKADQRYLINQADGAIKAL